jgi:hypothetical protein
MTMRRVLGWIKHTSHRNWCVSSACSAFRTVTSRLLGQLEVCLFTVLYAAFANQDAELIYTDSTACRSRCAHNSHVSRDCVHASLAADSQSDRLRSPHEVAGCALANSAASTANSALSSCDAVLIAAAATHPLIVLLATQRSLVLQLLRRLVARAITVAATVRAEIAAINAAATTAARLMLASSMCLLVP